MFEFRLFCCARFILMFAFRVFFGASFLVCRRVVAHVLLLHPCVLQCVRVWLLLFAFCSLTLATLRDVFANLHGFHLFMMLHIVCACLWRSRSWCAARQSCCVKFYIWGSFTFSFAITVSSNKKNESQTCDMPWFAKACVAQTNAMQ